MERIRAYFKDKVHLTYLIIFLLLLVLNCLTTPTSDDLGYSINNGLFDIFQKEYTQYMTWTGRSVAHILARIFLSFPKGIFNVLNSLCFLVLIHLMNQNATERVKDNPAFVVAATILVFLFSPVFGQTVLWETGSCNYLWTTMIILAFLKQYRFPKKHKTSWAVIMFFFGIVAGWTNENTGGACILLVILFFLDGFKAHKRHEAWMYTGLMGTILGFVIMIKAPGNTIRSQDFVHNEGIAYQLIHDLNNILDVFSQQPGQLVLWILFAIGLSVALIKKSQNKKIACFYALSSVAAVSAIALSPVPVLYDRSMFGATILLVMAVLALYGDAKEALPTVSTVAIGIGALFTVFSYGYALVDLSYTRYQYNQREAWVVSQKEQGNKNPVLPEINSEFFTSYNARNGLNDILSEATFVNNENYAITHELESVTSTTQEKWNLMYKNGDAVLMNIQDLNTYLEEIESRDVMIILNASNIDDTYQNTIACLQQYGFILQDGDTFCTIQNGKQVLSGSDMIETTIGNHYFYVSSNQDKTLSDILIDNQEYTNDNSGINIVVYDTSTEKVLDSVTFGAQGNANRSYSEG